MNKKIYLLFICLLIFCSGCTAEYTLSIHDDFSINETFTAMEDADFYNSYPKTPVQNVIGFILEPNREYFNINKYQIDQIINTRDAGIKGEKTYNSLDELKEKSKIPSQIADNWSYVDNGDSITLSLNGELSQEEQSQDGRYKIDEAKINIVVPFEVMEHNADSNKDNTYTWILDEKNKQKEISITFNKVKKVDKGEEPPYIIFGIIIVVILIVGIGIYSVIGNSKHRNNIED